MELILSISLLVLFLTGLFYALHVATSLIKFALVGVAFVLVLSQVSKPTLCSIAKEIGVEKHLEICQL